MTSLAGCISLLLIGIGTIAASILAIKNEEEIDKANKELDELITRIDHIDRITQRQREE